MQPGFFDQEDRPAKLEKLGDHLLRLESIVDWQAFRPLLKIIHQKQCKSNAERKPHDVTVMFMMLVLQSLYNLSDDQTEFQVRDGPRKRWNDILSPRWPVVNLLHLGKGSSAPLLREELATQQKPWGEGPQSVGCRSGDQKAAGRRDFPHR